MASRPVNRAVVLMRRSGQKQELSLSQQLKWAQHRSKELGTKFSSTEADLTHALKYGLTKYKDMYFDTKSGNDLGRAGLQECLSDVRKDLSVSHVLVYRRDRFARAEDPVDALALESQLSRGGVTIVFGDQIVPPIESGTSNIGNKLLALVEYDEAGKFRVALAKRIVESKVTLGKGGYWNGGIPSYGFGRVLVDSQGNVVQKLAPGYTVRQAGCHVRIMPDDVEKIALRLEMLKWYYVEGMGGKRIAKRLNAMGIPSPGAGRTRIDNGIRHTVSGCWNEKTVLALIKDKALLGVLETGKTTKGGLYRIGPDGQPRFTDLEGERIGVKGKSVKSSTENIISAPAGFQAPADPALFQNCQEQIAARAKTQQGISRAPVPGRYPLAMRVYDLTDACGHPLYGKQIAKVSHYVCGRYLRTSGAQCNYNRVNADQLLRFVLALLRDRTDRAGGVEALRVRIERIANDAHVQGVGHTQKNVENLKRALQFARTDLERTIANLARAKDQQVFDEISAIRKRQKADVEALEVRLAQAENLSSITRTGTAERIEAALALYENLEQLASNQTAGIELAKIFQRLGMRIGLSFAEVAKGKRTARSVVGGLICFGDEELPVKPYGRDNVDADTDDEQANNPDDVSGNSIIRQEERQFPKGKAGTPGEGGGEGSSSNSDAAPEDGQSPHPTLSRNTGRGDAVAAAQQNEPTASMPRVCEQNEPTAAASAGAIDDSVCWTIPRARSASTL